MKDFFLEIYGEEIPPNSQINGENELKKSLEIFFQEKKIKFSEISSYSTSRRFIIITKNVSQFAESENLEIRGPRVEANEKAISGFMKSNDVKTKKQLQIKKIKDVEYFFIFKNLKSDKVEDLLKSNLNKILSSIKWKKSMRWSSFDERWIRPIRNILCMFGSKKIVFSYAGVTSNDFSFGNYQLNRKKIKFIDTQKYLKLLKQNFVLIDRNERMKIVKNKLLDFCNKKKLKKKFDENQIRRISDTVEYPNVYFGTFDKSYFEIPDFLLRSIISEKQDFFYFQKQDDELLNCFAFISNKISDKKSKLIVGNENVLKARFSDAIFFLEEDKKVSFQQRLELLKDIVFYENVGTLYDRSLRIKEITQIISRKLNYNLSDDIKKNLQYSNIDLTTELVKEFPILQGKVGGFYASLAGFKNDLCNAFSDQYNLSFDKRNNNILSFILSISQKIDSIYGFFLTGKKLTGAGDPFGLRRSAIGIIKISLEKKINVEYSEILNICHKFYNNQGIKININKTLLEDFLNKRLYIYLNDLGFRQDSIKSVLSDMKFNPYLIYEKVKVLESFIESKEGKLFLKAFKRLDSIAPRNNQKVIFDLSVFNEEEEKILLESLSKIKKTITKKPIHSINELKKLNIISDPINNFLDKIKVNVDDEILKKNRQNLLLDCRNTLNCFYNFSNLEINET